MLKWNTGFQDYKIKTLKFRKFLGVFREKGEPLER